MNANNAGGENAQGDIAKEIKVLAQALETNTKQFSTVIKTLSAEIRTTLVTESSNVTRELSKQRNERRDGEDLKEKNLGTFFQNIGAISTLGSGFTFALIVLQLQDPAEVSKAHHFDLSTVRIFVATSWLLFTVTLLLGILLSVILKLIENANTKKVLHIWVLVSLYLLQGGAFTFLALAVAAYVDVVGFLVLGLVWSVPVIWMLLHLCGIAVENAMGSGRIR
jgi:hypothetical protein